MDAQVVDNAGAEAITSQIDERPTILFNQLIFVLFSYRIAIEKYLDYMAPTLVICDSDELMLLQA